MFKRAKQRVKNHDLPKAYQTKSWYFFEFPLFVNRSVLVPRFDTEVLVENVIKEIEAFVGNSCGRRARVLDLCTGSGCIGVAIGKLTGAEIYASDVSRGAIRVARKNFKKNGVKAKLFRGDLFENIDEKFDFIVSNPPYIKTDEIGIYDASILYEPRIALDGGEDGLAFYRRIITDAPLYLENGGVLALEIDDGEGVKSLLQQAGFCDIKIIKDLGGFDRVAICRKS